VVVIFHSKSDKNNNPKCFHPPVCRPRCANNNNGANATKTKGVNGIGSQAKPNKIAGNTTNNPLGILIFLMRSTMPILSLFVMLRSEYFCLNQFSTIKPSTALLLRTPLRLNFRRPPTNHLQPWRCNPPIPLQILPWVDAV
jgi:hypothetical protein